jgi:GrpB-like predicted nucleotidyltransferase (UPF0157 family)
MRRKRIYSAQRPKNGVTDMASVVVSPYSAEWPNHFHVVREQLLSVFAPMAVAVEHVGSTSVPGLAAKPVIDILLGARTLADIESKIEPLGELGFEHVQKYERELPMRRYFVKASATSLRIHLHAVERGSRFWREQLAFRDALRADPALRSRYQALKLRLAEEFADDKSAYTAAKGPFIQSMLADVCE